MYFSKEYTNGELLTNIAKYHRSIKLIGILGVTTQLTINNSLI